MIAFETGRIRPPSEATSILLRLTRNCGWNQCVFCPVYKQEPFSIRTIDEIKRDVDAIVAIAESTRHQTSLRDNTEGNCDAAESAIGSLGSGQEMDSECVRLVAFWMSHGLKSMFLQDGDALVLPTTQLVEILDHVRAAFPTITRITSYARARTVARKSAEELEALRAAGLSRIHIGMESGSDAVLSLVRKGVTQDVQIRAGRQVMAAGIELSEYLMPGLGGRELSKEHAVESAAALNAIDPTYIRIRSTVPVPGTPLHDMMAEGQWIPLTEEEKVHEIKSCLERLNGITSTVQSDHIMNLLEDVAGDLPDAKDQMLEPINRFLSMGQVEREAFIVGRRTGRYRHVSDYAPDNEVELIRRELIARFGTIDRAAEQILLNFI